MRLEWFTYDVRMSLEFLLIVSKKSSPRRFKEDGGTAKNPIMTSQAMLDGEALTASRVIEMPQLDLTS
jgi:hypothetical protein